MIHVGKGPNEIIKVTGYRARLCVVHESTCIQCDIEHERSVAIVSIKSFENYSVDLRRVIVEAKILLSKLFKYLHFGNWRFK